MLESDEGCCADFRHHARFVGACMATRRRFDVLSRRRSLVDSSEMQVEVGAIVDRYRIESVLGRGGMGQVYRALDLRLRRPVALKILHESLSVEAMARLVREARLAASLSHPNIVAVFDVGEHLGMPFMAMELVEGRQLRELVGARVHLQEKLRWLLDVARGLEAAHRAGLVHRDVKPQNVMVTASGAKVLDFGIAKELADAGRNATALLPSMRTQPGFSMGTPQYMAPEVLRGERESDARTDQFSWGLVAYQLITGERARRNDLEEGTPWEPPRITVEGVGERVLAVIDRTLAESHLARFPAMGDVANALEASLTPLPRTVAQGMRTSEQSEASAPRFAPTRLFPVHAPEPEKPKADSPAGRRKSQRPPAMSAPPPPAPPIREPARHIVQPLANAALAELNHAVPVGFRRAVLIVTLDVEKSKARFFVQLVATDETGELWSPDASMDLVKAAGTMIADDARDGNGRWQRLVIQLHRGAREAVVGEVA